VGEAQAALVSCLLNQQKPRVAPRLTKGFLMENITYFEPTPQIGSSILLQCQPGAELARRLREAQAVIKTGDTERRQASRARHLIGVLKRHHRHCASCVPCLLREALTAGMGA
jgi:hypothetical protein